jgi:hypothetical protein
MHHKVGGNDPFALWSLRAHTVFLPGMLDGVHGVLRAHVYSNLAKLFHQPADQLRVESRQHPFAALKHSHFRASTRGGISSCSSSSRLASTVPANKLTPVMLPPVG